jgi:hypothetical protein
MKWDKKTDIQKNMAIDIYRKIADSTTRKNEKAGSSGPALDL